MTNNIPSTELYLNKYRILTTTISNLFRLNVYYMVSSVYDTVINFKTNSVHQNYRILNLSRNFRRNTVQYCEQPKFLYIAQDHFQQLKTLEKFYTCLIPFSFIHLIQFLKLQIQNTIHIHLYLHANGAYIWIPITVTIHFMLCNVNDLCKKAKWPRTPILPDVLKTIDPLHLWHSYDYFVNWIFLFNTYIGHLFHSSQDYKSQILVYIKITNNFISFHYIHYVHNSKI